MKVITKILVLCLAFSVCFSKRISANDDDDGSEATIAQFPHQVSLRRNGSHFCGGCIIDQYYILTAAHCVVDSNSSIYDGITVLSGTANRKNVLNGEIHKIDQIAYNDGYTPSEAREHDIAIIKLKNPINFTSSQQPAKFPDSVTAVNTIVLVSGWGRTIKNNSQDHLLFLRKVVMSKYSCSEKFVRQNYTQKRISTNDICVWSGINQKHCVNDSGSPLTDYTGHVIGISSSPAGCEEELPDIFIRVEKYMKWIKSIMDGNTTSNVFNYPEIISTTTEQYISTTTEKVPEHWWQRVANNIHDRCSGKWFCF